MRNGRGRLVPIRLIRKFSILAVVTAIVATLAACTGASTPSAGRLPVEKRILVAAVVPAADSAGFYIAAQDGFFKDEGLDVKIVPAISSETVITDQLAGKLDITVGNYVSYIKRAANHGARLRLIDEGSVMRPGTQVILVPANSPITTVGALKGKRIGVNVLGNIGELLVNSVLQDYGMASSDVHFVPVPFPKMAGMLKAHKLDAAWLPEPFASAAQEQIGAQTLVDADQGATIDLPISGVVVTRAWAEKYPGTVAALQRALAKAQVIADTNRGAVERAMMTYVGLSQVQAALMAEDNYPAGAVNRIRVQRVANLMLQFGILEKPFSVTALLS